MWNYLRVRWHLSSISSGTSILIFIRLDYCAFRPPRGTSEPCKYVITGCCCVMPIYVYIWSRLLLSRDTVMFFFSLFSHGSWGPPYETEKWPKIDSENPVRKSPFFSSFLVFLRTKPLALFIFFPHNMIRNIIKQKSFIQIIINSININFTH